MIKRYRKHYTITFEPLMIGTKALLEKTYIKAPKHGITLIKGPNGSGKSLAIRRLFLASTDIHSVLVDQNKNLILRELSVLENIAMSKAPPTLETAKAFLEDHAFVYLLKRDVKKMSGGEKRLLVLLRGLFAKCEMVFIDEPTNDLDYHVVKKVLELIKRLSLDRTFIIITHDDRLDAMAHSIYLLQDQRFEVVKVPLNARSLTDDSVSPDQQVERLEAAPKQVVHTGIRRRLFSQLIFVFLSVITIVGVTILWELREDMIPYMAPNEVHLMGRDSQFPTSIDEGVLPVSFLATLLGIGDHQSEDLVNELEGLSQNFAPASASDLPRFPMPQHAQAFLMEFAPTRNAHQILTLEEYLFTFHQLSLDDAVLMTDRYFDNPFRDTLFADPKARQELPVVQLDRDNFDRLITDLQTTESMVTHYLILRFDDASSMRAYLSDLYDLGYLGLRFLVRSNETIHLVNQSKSLFAVRVTTAFVALGFIVVLGFDAMYHALYFRFQKRNTSSFINYGYERRTLTQAFKKRYRIRVLPIVLVVLVSAWIRWFSPSEGLIPYIGDVVLILVLSVTYTLHGCMSKLILNQHLKRHFSWRYR